MKIPSDARSLSSESQEVLRNKTIEAIKRGMSQVEAARLFGVTRQAVGRWVKKYRVSGLRSLTARKKGRPSGQGRLKGWQAATICNIIKDRNPQQLKLPFFLWTAGAVRDLIIQRFAIKYSVRSVQRLLQKWGFTPQKPCRRAYERDPKAVTKWLKQTYPRLKMLAKRTKSLILWLDEMGMRSDHQAGTTYGQRGVTPTIYGTGKRFGCNMLSAIANRGDLMFMLFKGKFNSVVFTTFLSRLIRQRKQRIILIVDNHTVHKSKKSISWVGQHKDRIRLEYLPGYCPELNPDEMLNNDVKANAIGRKRPKDLVELQGNVRKHLRRKQANREEVKKYFQAISVRYAA